jgi:hypothetical protein
MSDSGIVLNNVFRRGFAIEAARQLPNIRFTTSAQHRGAR